MAGVGEQRYTLTPEQVHRLLSLVERGLTGEIDRLTIDFREQQMYVDEWSRTGRTERLRRAA